MVGIFVAECYTWTRVLYNAAQKSFFDFFWGANNMDDPGKSLLRQCSPAGSERLTPPLVSATDTSERPSSAACRNQSHFAGGLKAARALISTTRACENLRTHLWEGGRVFRSSSGILTEAAGEGCSSLPHYLTCCVGAKPEGVSERGSTWKRHCGHVYCLHNQHFTSLRTFGKKKRDHQHWLRRLKRWILETIMHARQRCLYVNIRFADAFERYIFYRQYYCLVYTDEIQESYLDSHFVCKDVMILKCFNKNMFHRTNSEERKNIKYLDRLHRV